MKPTVGVKGNLKQTASFGSPSVQQPSSGSRSAPGLEGSGEETPDANAFAAAGRLRPPKSGSAQVNGMKPSGGRTEESSTEDRVGQNGGWSSGSVVNEAPQSIGATVNAEDQRVERELVARCLAGAQSAAREFVERYQSIVYGVCLRMLADVQDAEDAAQDTFVRALRALERWDGERPIRPWLLTIAANRCRTYLSRRPKRAATCEFPEEIADCRPNSQMQADASELNAAIRNGLDSLREDYRQAFLLYHEQGLSYAEISATLAKPVGTLKTWLHRARNELLSYLKRQGHAAEIERDDPGV